MPSREVVISSEVSDDTGHGVSSREVAISSEVSNDVRDRWDVLGVISCEVVYSRFGASEVSIDGTTTPLSIPSQFAFLRDRFELGSCFLIDSKAEVRT